MLGKPIYVKLLSSLSLGLRSGVLCFWSVFYCLRTARASGVDQPVVDIIFELLLFEDLKLTLPKSAFFFERDLVVVLLDIISLVSFTDKVEHVVSLRPLPSILGTHLRVDMVLVKEGRKDIACNTIGIRKHLSLRVEWVLTLPRPSDSG